MAQETSKLAEKPFGIRLCPQTEFFYDDFENLAGFIFAIYLIIITKPQEKMGWCFEIRKNYVKNSSGNTTKNVISSCF